MTDGKLERLSKLLYGLTLACQIALPIIVGVVFVALSVGIRFSSAPEGSEASGLFLWLGVAVGLIPAIALFWALDLLRRLFQHYKDGKVLTRDAAHLIGKTGTAMLLLAGLKIFAHPIQTLLLTWQSPPGSRQIAISIGQAEIGFILIAGLLTVIGWAMTEAARVAEENRGFV